MEDSAINRLPEDTLHKIFSFLSLRQIMICRCVCKSFYQTLNSPPFLHLISSLPPLNLFAFRPPHHLHGRHVSSDRFLHVYEPEQDVWLRFNLDFVPFPSPHPVASSLGLVYLWADSSDAPDSSKLLIVCNPLTRQYRVLPQLGSAWSRHGSVLVDSRNRVMVLTELAALCFSPTLKNQWLKYSSNLPSKPRSPILVSDVLFALCEVGSPWRSQWKLFSCTTTDMKSLKVTHYRWECLERCEWGNIFDIMKRPRLVCGKGNKILMIGGLKSIYSLNSSCPTILILRLDLESMEWEEAGRMPMEMYQWFQEKSKFKVFGGGDKVCFSAKKIGRLVLWDGCQWRWIDGVRGRGDAMLRGFMFEARHTAVP